VVMARCDSITNSFHGGCGANGRCEQAVPSVHTTTSTAPIEGTGFVTGAANTGQLTLPSSPKLAVPPVAGYPSAWYLVACFIPAGAIRTLPSNVKQLDDVLTVIKEPTDAVIPSWFQYQVHELKFTMPQQGVWTGVESSPPDYKNLATGLPGDIVVLQKDDCAGVHSISTSNFAFEQGHSAKFTLQEVGGDIGAGDEKGGTALEYSLAIGKVNELSVGIYKICYATSTSGGESQEDFKELTKTIEILPTPATKPKLSAPRSVILGQDIVVSWASNIGLEEVQSDSNSWLGLFKRDSCPTTHDCYVSYQFIRADFTGTVIFSQSDYKISGEFEVRYFKGTTRNGQGIVCRGQPGVTSETYVYCGLEAATTSEVITVAGQDIDQTEDLTLWPGLEAVFGHGNRGRYHRKKV